MMISALKRIFFITLGCFAAAYALECFLVPNKIIDGGVVGISIMAHYITTIVGAVPEISLGVFLVVLNIPFIFLALKNFGWEFVFQTLYGIIMLAVFVSLIEFAHLKVVTDDLILDAIFGGILLGAGVGLVLRNNASLDGTEILAIKFNSKTAFSVGEIIMFLNIFIFTCAGFLFGWDRAMYSCLTYFTAYKVIDMVLQGFEESKSIFIVSDKNNEIGQEMMHKLDKGVTYINAEGGYSGAKKKMLWSVVNRFEITKLKEIVSSIDDEAFIAIQDVHEVDGRRYRKKKH